MREKSTHQFKLLHGGAVLRFGATRRSRISLAHVGVGIVAHGDEEEAGAEHRKKGSTRETRKGKRETALS